MADVPVGSTTYHFVDKDELLLAAVELAAASGSASLDELFQECRPEEDLAKAVVRWIGIVVREHRDQLTLHYELFLAARRNPALRARQTLVPETYDLFRAYTDDARARTLVDIVEGTLARVVVFGKELVADELEARLARVLDS